MTLYFNLFLVCLSVLNVVTGLYVIKLTESIEHEFRNGLYGMIAITTIASAIHTLSVLENLGGSAYMLNDVVSVFTLFTVHAYFVWRHHTHHTKMIRFVSWLFSKLFRV